VLQIALFADYTTRRMSTSRGNSRGRRPALAVVLFALVGLLSACGDDSSRAGASQPVAEASPTPTRAPRNLGPGLGNLQYEESELFQPVGIVTSPRGHGNAAMVGGYLMVIYSSDGGGRSGDGGIDFWDVSDPRQPVLFQRFDDADTHALREAHGFAFSTSYPYDVMAAQSEEGIQLWDVTDPSAIALLSTLDLPHINGGDYAGIWWLFFQAPYIYAAGVGEGLYIIDARDPTNPVLASWMATSELGGVSPAQVYAVGNLLVMMAHESDRVVTVDVSDPLRPRLLQSGRGAFGYSHLFAGGKVLTSGGPQLESVIPILGGGEPIFAPRTLGITEVGHDGSIAFVRHGEQAGLDQGGYGSVQDGFFFSGFSKQVAKFDLASGALSGIATAGLEDSDEDFGLVLGNLIWGGNDHGQGTALFVHQTAPDTQGPAIDWVQPADGATDQSVSTPIGVSMTDAVDFYSVDASTFRVSTSGGAPVAGKYSVQMGLVNFVPDQPLATGKTYEVRISGIRDVAGNPGPTFVSHFTTGAVALPTCQLANPALPLTPGQSGVPVELSALAVSSTRGTPRFSWDFGDGVALDTTAPAADHTYAQPGRYNVVLSVEDRGGRSSCSGVQIVAAAPTAVAASVASTIAYSNGRVFNVNPDSDTISAIDPVALAKLWERPAGIQPRTIAVAPDGLLWVANQDDATVTVHSPSAGELLRTIELPFASQPYGVAVAPDGSAVFVTLQATHELLKLDPDGGVLARLTLPGKPRGVAVTADSQRVVVTRFLSGGDNGAVWLIRSGDLGLERTAALHFDAGPDTEGSGRGVPNYLSSLAISPDGRRVVLPSKKDNLARGLFRDGQELTFESRVRTIVSQLDLESGEEIAAARIDLNDRDMAQAAVFSPYGDIFFVATQGTNTIEVIDTYRSQTIGSLSASQFEEVEGLGPRIRNLAPQGLAIDPEGRRLFVQNFLSRSVSVYDVEALVRGVRNSAPLLREIAVVASEKLTRAQLFGKRIFYNASDPRMSRDGYISCASCHLDGRSDAQVWDFTQAGEGLRNTIDLTGRAGLAHGRLHWTGNFDEVQDFENDIREQFSGRGFMREERFALRSDPLGMTKAGQSQELDLLTAYVVSLSRYPDSPHRNSDGSLSEAALRGREVFAARQCASCHAGPQFTDGQRHDVGTIEASSGMGIGESLTGVGFETPTLRGTWDSAPYLHNGSAATLEEVLATAAHAGDEALSVAERDDLIAYLRSIDGREPAAE